MELDIDDLLAAVKDWQCVKREAEKRPWSPEWVSWEEAARKRMANQIVDLVRAVVKDVLAGS